MPPTAVIPGWVSIASPLRYLTPMVETNSSGKIKAEVMVISINLLKTILLWLSQNNQLWKKAIEKNAESKQNSIHDLQPDERKGFLKSACGWEYGYLIADLFSLGQISL